MKKLFTCVSLMSLLLTACRGEQSDSAISKNAEYNKVLETIKLAGKEHNSNLDLIKNSLMKDKVLVSKLDRSSARIAEDADQFISYVNQLEYDAISEETFYADTPRDYLYESINNVNEQIIDEVTTPSGLLDYSSDLATQPWFDADEVNLTSKEKELLSLLEVAIKDQTLSYAATIAVFDNVYNRSQVECNEKEKLVIASAITIGKNSMTYWYQNADQWGQALNPERQASSRRVNWKNVGAADIAGGVGGALRTAVLAVYGGPYGAGAWVGGICAGAYAGSATSAVYQWLAD